MYNQTMERPSLPVAPTALLTLALGLLNLWRLIGLLREWPVLTAFGADVRLPLSVGLAGLATLSLPPLALWAWRRGAAAGRALLVALLLYGVAYTLLNGAALPTLLWHLTLIGLAAWGVVGDARRQRRHIPP